MLSNINVKYFLIPLVLLLVIMGLMLKSTNFTISKLLLSDRTINTEGFEQKLDDIIQHALKDSGFCKSELRDTKIINVDGSTKFKIQLFIFRKATENKWNDVEKIIEINAVKVNGLYRVESTKDINSRDDIPLSTIEPSEKYFDNNYRSRSWNEQKQQWECLEKSWKI